MSSFYTPVAERAAHRCEYCHAPEAVFTLRFEIDHIVPISLDGADTLNNLALACRACNLWKSNATEAIDPLTGAVARLFNPRQDAWLDHFAVTGVSSVRIIGKTPIGRATVERLRMNASAQCEARRWWTRIGLYP